jgi:hypothetical protein
VRTGEIILLKGTNLEELKKLKRIKYERFLDMVETTNKPNCSLKENKKHYGY